MNFRNTSPIKLTEAMPLRELADLASPFETVSAKRQNPTRRGESFTNTIQCKRSTPRPLKSPDLEVDGASGRKSSCVPRQSLQSGRMVDRRDGFEPAPSRVTVLEISLLSSRRLSAVVQARPMNC